MLNAVAQFAAANTLKRGFKLVQCNMVSLITNGMVVKLEARTN